MKILNDILTVNGKYSLKRVMAVITFIYVINLSTYVTICGKPNGIIDSLLILLAATLGLSTADKKFADKEELKDE